MLNGGAFCDAAHAAQRRRREISQHAPRRLGNWHARQGWRGLDRRKRRGLLTTTPQRSRHLGVFIFFFFHTSGTSIAYCACHTDLDMGPRRDHNDCMDMGLVHCSELGDFFSGAVGWLPCRQIFSGIFAGTLAPAAAIRYSSFVGWSLVSQS